MEGYIRVLVVDDHDILRRGISLSLGIFQDIEIVGQAADGSEAVQMCESLKPDVVLMDLLMPEVDGVTATRQIREKYPQIQVIALTSYDDKPLVQGAINAGAVSYILKNISVEEVVKAIRDAYQGKATLSPEVAEVLLNSVRHSSRAEVSLTDRELQVLTCMARGWNNVQIAQSLTISPATAQKHVANILHKLNVANRTEAVSFALQNNLVDKSVL
jgi:two-component system, NarL family, response regulator LiaR